MLYEDSFLPKLRFGIDVPLALERICEHCLQESVAINTSGDFSHRCYNPVCPMRHRIEYTGCFLSLRNYEETVMRLTLGDYIKLKFDEDTGKIEPDFNHKVYDAIQTTGPYRDCTGTLSYDDGRRLEAVNWLHCNVCRAEYRVMVFAEYGLSGERLVHDRYRWRKTERGVREVLVSSDGGLKMPSHDLAMWIDNIRFHGIELVGRLLEAHR